jgi:hypothetical protein
VSRPGYYGNGSECPGGAFERQREEPRIRQSSSDIVECDSPTKSTDEVGPDAAGFHAPRTVRELDSKDVSRRARPVCACHDSLELIMQRPSAEELAGVGLSGPYPLRQGEERGPWQGDARYGSLRRARKTARRFATSFSTGAGSGLGSGAGAGASRTIPAQSQRRQTLR